MCAYAAVSLKTHTNPIYYAEAKILNKCYNTAMARYNRKKITRLRKSHIGLSIFALITISALGAVLLFVAFSFVITFLVKTKCENDANRVLSMAESYNSEIDENSISVFSILGYQNVDYFIEDKDGNIIHESGTNSLDHKKRIDFNQIMVIESAGDYNKISVYGDKANGILDPVFLLSGESDPFKVTQMLLNQMSQITKTSTNDEITTEVNVTGKVDLPYWLSVDLKDGNRLYCRGGLSIDVSDVAFSIVIVSTLGLLVVVVTLILFINVFVNFADQKKMKKLLFMDKVSDNHNWIRFYLDAGERLEKRSNAKRKYAMVNLVFIKYRNFVLCHSVEEGELELRKVYNVIRSYIGKCDLIGHDNSSSFALLLQYRDENELRMFIQGLISKLEKVNEYHKFNFQAGVELIPASPRKRRGVDVDSIYNDACAARMTLEGTGESGIAFFDKKLLDDHRWVDKVHEHQQAAIDNEEFIVYYQPKYNPVNEELVGVEALIRWQSPEIGFVAPGRFIPIFEENGFITEVDHYMIRHVARDQKKWLDQGYECVTCSVNVSRAHFIEEDLAEQIRDIVAEEGCPPEYLEIELTESAFFDNKTVLLNTIGHLKQYGFSVSMDDFGSGYSSLNSLKDLPLDVLKLDAGFFSGLTEEGSRGEIVVSEAIKLAKNLNMKTVAEGIEEREQVDFLAKEGCDMIQGYFYAKPMPAEDYESRMVKRVATVEESVEEPVAEAPAVEAPAAPEPENKEAVPEQDDSQL